MMHKIFSVIALALVMGVASPAHADNIVYGSNWAFVSATPQGWSSACCNHAMHGTNITLWPASEKPDATDALIYVTVSDVHPKGLAAFAQQDEQTFAQSSSKAHFAVVRGMHKLSSYKYIVVRYGEPAAGRVELVTYLAGPNAYYMIVLTANAAVTLDRYKQSYFSYVSAFIPMVRK